MARRYKSKRAGSLAGLINQAVVPFGILALQQTYKKTNMVENVHANAKVEKEVADIIKYI